MIHYYEFAPAKINLYLHICAKHEDGYHQIDSLVIFCTAGDILHAIPSTTGDISLDIIGSYGNILQSEKDINSVNICANYLKEKFNIATGAHFILDKRLPVASGIGGGSTDGASSIRLLQRLWNIQITTHHLYEMMQLCGTDLVSCFRLGTHRITGKGNILLPFPSLPSFVILMVNPHIQVYTSDIYKHVQCTQQYPCDSSNEPPPYEGYRLMEWVKQQRNDLQPITTCLYQPVQYVLHLMQEIQPQPFFSRMSGSGATCFSIYSDIDSAQSALSKIRSIHPEWWCQIAIPLHDI